MGRLVGPFSTNLLRLGLASLVLLVVMGFRILGGSVAAFPSTSACLWLAGSGIIGLVIGDFFLYRALTTEGPEKTSQIQTLAPAATAVIAWFFLREILSTKQILGMMLVLGGVFMATWETSRIKQKNNLKMKPTTTVKLSAWLLNGMWAALWSSLFQGVGTVMAREAFRSQANLDPVLATTIRITIGSLVIWIFAASGGSIRKTLAGCSDRRVLRLLLWGTLAGPLVGMVCYVSALKFSPAGVVSTITFMNPLIVIPLGAWHYGTRVGPVAIIGTAVSLAGVLLLGFG